MLKVQGSSCIYGENCIRVYLSLLMQEIRVCTHISIRDSANRRPCRFNSYQKLHSRAFEKVYHQLIAVFSFSSNITCPDIRMALRQIRCLRQLTACGRSSRAVARMSRRGRTCQAPQFTLLRSPNRLSRPWAALAITRSHQLAYCSHFSMHSIHVLKQIEG